MFEIVKKDEMFYHQSGGGLTIGGGEATLCLLYTSNLAAAQTTFAGAPPGFCSNSLCPTSEMPY